MTIVSAQLEAKVWRVVVIDDCPDDRAEARRLLLRGSERRYKLAEAETGAAGVRAILDAADLPDCVILDYNLPDMDAVEVLAALAGPDGLTVCPVVVLTGTVCYEQTRMVLWAGAQDYLGKGWMTPESLTRAVENAAERWAMARELQDRDAALRETNLQLQMSLSAGRAVAFTWDIPSNEVRRLHGLDSCIDATTDKPETFEEISAKVHPNDRDHFESRVRHAIERPGREYTNEYRLVGPDGSVRWLSDTGRVDFSADEKPLRLVGLATDITDRRQAEEKLRESESLFTIALKHSGILLYTTDADLRYTWIHNPHPTFDPADILGRRDDELLSPEQAAPLTAIKLDVLNRGAGRRAEFAVEINGEPVVYDLTVEPLQDGTGSVVGVTVAAMDITARKREENAVKISEVRYRRLFESAKDGILILDAQAATITHANPFMAELLGYSPEEFLGKELWQIGLFPDVEASKGAIQQLQQKGYIRYEDLPLETKAGRRINVEFVSNVYGGDGEAVIQCNIRDISDRKRLEESLRRHAADLSEADRRKDEFLATLAHELRNPLAPIRNGLQIMKLTKVDAGTVEKTRSMMERQVEQMTRLIDDLMDVSRINQGKIVLQKTRMSLADAVRNAVDTSQPMIDLQRHELVVDLPPEPIYFDADLTRLSQVFANLLNNSAKYTNPGGRIRLSVERRGDDAVVSVSDNGVGIAADKLAHVFDMFAQIDGSSEQSQGGLGIGLNIVKRLVEMHGGTITAESGGPGIGSTFTVRLPLALSSADETSDDPSTDVQNNSAARRRILVVDDNRDSALTLAMMLKLMGHDTQTSRDGLEAVAVSEAFKPDVILMDIGMPKLNGYDACRRIRKQPWGNSIVIVALTGWGQEQDRQKSRDAGFNGHLVKPVDHTELMKILANLQGNFESM